MSARMMAISRRDMGLVFMTTRPASPEMTNEWSAS
jgi:hypothetical protein